MSSQYVNATPALYHRFQLPQMHEIISEWAALIPLIVHLASPKGDHNLIGELALSGKLTLSVLPKLGHLNGIAQLLSGISDFLDRASTKGDLSSIVWDVDWASSFACANGAARCFLTQLALQKSCQVIDVEAETTNSGIFRRYQTLHVIEINKRTTPCMSAAKQFWYSVFHTSHIPLLLVLAVLLILCGAYGTAATALLCVATQVASRYVPIGRPAGYLRNNEKHEYACMVSAIHTNASTWYLYVGDRASIDWLLNKTMIKVDTDNPMPWSWVFRVLHYLQLLAMTFVAGNKGWDGVFLVCLLVLNMIFKVICDFPAHRAAARWTSDSNLVVDAHTFRLTGRVPMLGAIQMLSDSRKPHRDGFVPGDVSWMDNILPPSSRRGVWAQELGNAARRRSGILPLATNPNADEPPESDREWIENNLKWTRDAYEHIRGRLKYTPISLGDGNLSQSSDEKIV